MTMSDQLITLETSSKVAYLTLDSPANRNALSEAMLEQLLAALGAAVGAPEVRLLVLSHTGSVFCSGADLKEQARIHQATGASPGAGGLVPILEAMLASPKPIICRVDGAVRGGGMGLVAASDVAIASPASSFAFSEVRVGVAPAVISVPVLARISRTAALELFLTGRVFSAEEAASAGLLTRTSQPGELDQEISAVVEELLRGAPTAQAEAKRLISAVPPMEPKAAFQLMIQLSARLFSSPEGQEGMAAFKERRPPPWSL